MLLASAWPASALDYVHPSRATLLYDAPSTAATKIVIAGRGLPLEVVVDTQSWAKVRGPDGQLAWIEKSVLGETRYVMVRQDASIIRQQPRLDANAVFRAERGVLLELTGETERSGWLPVKNANGLSGWLAVNEIWGR